MMLKFKSFILFFIVFLSFRVDVHAQQNNKQPRLVHHNGVTQLFVDGKPFLIFGGELGNSTSSNINYMRPVWRKLKSMHLNTVLAPVYWELLEPAEGKFDFTLIDSMMADARKQDLKLIILWFGSWKNSMSCYAPEWIKLNQQKFECAKDSKGNGLEILSAFNKINLTADMNAFATLMKHIARVDSMEKTVLMVQVENEIGMLTEAREYTDAANLAFHQKVPEQLMDYLKKNKNELVPEFVTYWSKNGFSTTGSWEEMFGKSLATDELFQAWQYAIYTNAVAAAGKKTYDIPMYVNAALNYKNVLPGQYPSGGPLPHLMDIWQAAAPAIDILSPDFYNPYFRSYCDLYSRRNNPFFIPEIRSEPGNAAKVFLALGHYKAIGFSPFSIESDTTALEQPLAKSYGLLQQLSSLILENQVTGKIEGVLMDSNFQKQELIMGDYKLTISHEYSLGWSPGSKEPGWPESGGLIIQTAQNEFIIAGTGIVVNFSSAKNPNSFVGILQAYEGDYMNGQWIPGRRMNGDQDHQGRHIRIPVKEFSIQRVKLYDYR
jgi:beta-galactosidase GanA